MPENLTDQRQATLDEYRERLLTGKAFALAEMSHRTRYGYQPPVNHRDWSRCMKLVADFASMGEQYAQIARSIFGRVNLYGTPSQCSASVYSAAGEALRAGYTDYVGLAGPEPGRRSDRQRDFTLRERVVLMFWLTDMVQPWSGTAPGYGWCLTALADELGYTHRPPSR